MTTLQPAIIGIVGKQLKEDFWGTVAKLAEFGYRGFEGIPPHDNLDELRDGAKKLRDLGIPTITTSASREKLRDELDAVVDQAKAAGVDRVSCWWGPAESAEQLATDAALYDAAGKRLADEGVRLAYHHHDHEFNTVIDGRPALDHLVDQTDPAHLGFVIDLAWVAVGGEDPAAVIRRLGKRVTSLHVKDVIKAERQGEDRQVPWTCVGTGVVPIVEGCEAAQEVGVTWAAVEQDKPRHLQGLELAQASLLNLRELGVV
jgi:sugar phosphate isomerase/epimerase